MCHLKRPAVDGTKSVNDISGSPYARRSDFDDVKIWMARKTTSAYLLVT